MPRATSDSNESILNIPTEEDDSNHTAVVVPQVDESERTRIRRSNDHDQALEREGETAPHNEGYDEAAKGGNRGT
jgi:hypothetical protein